MGPGISSQLLPPPPPPPPSCFFSFLLMKPKTLPSAQDSKSPPTHTQGKYYIYSGSSRPQKGSTDPSPLTHGPASLSWKTELVFFTASSIISPILESENAWALLLFSNQPDFSFVVKEHCAWVYAALPHAVTGAVASPFYRGGDEALRGRNASCGAQRHSLTAHLPCRARLCYRL